jgi:putative redox protein
MKIELDEGLRFTIDHRDIQTMADQTIKEGGTDQGHSPLELMIGSIGACAATMIAYYCNNKKIDITGLSVDVTWEKQKKPYRLAKVDVKINYPGEADEKLQKTLERVAHTCIVHRSFMEPPEINIRFPWTE